MGALVAAFEAAKPKFGEIDDQVAKVVALTAALQEPDIGALTAAQWYVTRLRLTYAALRTHIMEFKAGGLSWRGLCVMVATWENVMLMAV